jgi:hypothetical protein
MRAHQSEGAHPAAERHVAERHRQRRAVRWTIAATMQTTLDPEIAVTIFCVQRCIWGALAEAADHSLADELRIHRRSRSRAAYRVRSSCNGAGWCRMCCATSRRGTRTTRRRRSTSTATAGSQLTRRYDVVPVRSPVPSCWPVMLFRGCVCWTHRVCIPHEAAQGTCKCYRSSSASAAGCVLATESCFGGEEDKCVLEGAGDRSPEEHRGQGPGAEVTALKAHQTSGMDIRHGMSLRVTCALSTAPQ